MKKKLKGVYKKSKHGIISVVQTGSDSINKTAVKGDSGNIKKHGIISVVQSPNEETTSNSEV